jgi:DNA-binding XRE family transcriptional regulator
MNGREMARARKKTGMTQEEFGRELGIRRETVNRWERSWRDIPKAFEMAIQSLNPGGKRGRQIKSTEDEAYNQPYKT